ncbi:TPA: protein translocase subunit SecD [Candidatus Dependentiae bacterium]|nr:protein translocase subunit SecD [Candidatus Dependentiae bacterium]
MTVTLRRLVFSRLSILVFLTGLGGWFLYNLNSYVKFGIDLVGGTYITLDVQVEKAYENALVDLLNSVDDIIPASAKAQLISKEIRDNSVRVSFSSVGARNQAADLISQRMQGAISIETIDEALALRLPRARLDKIARDAVASNVNALTTRLNRFGVSEILVAQHGNRRIVVELPNVHDIQQAKSLIGRVAELDFKIVEDSAATEDALLERYGGSVPEGMIILPGEGARGSEYYLVAQYGTLSGRDLEMARGELDHSKGLPVVSFKFKPDAARRFYELTANVGRQIAIVLDGVVISAPVANEPIAGGSGVISGNFTTQSANELALLLSSGAFVAPVTFEEERHIGPSLGQEAVHQGMLACAVGGLLLLLFCLLVYKMGGLIAFVVLLYNILLSLALLAGLGATLTLPGIAGLLLTIGVAVDASILIYERIKEELRNGAPLRRAIDAGFAGSLAVILDSNITAFLGALVLYIYASGPVRGFAATQMVGILATLITGLWLLKSMLTYLTDVLGVGKLKI